MFSIHVIHGVRYLGCNVFENKTLPGCFRVRGRLMFQPMNISSNDQCVHVILDQGNDNTNLIQPTMLSCKVQWISDVCCAALANTLLPVLCLRPPPVPEPAKPSPGPLHHPATSVTLPQASHPPSSSSSSVRTNGKRAPPSTQQTPQQQTPPQPPSSSSGPRYPPREVPPRFRQQEHKQLLKRGQPLPAGALSSLTVTPASNPLTPGAPASSSSSAGKRHTGQFPAYCVSPLAPWLDPVPQ